MSFALHAVRGLKSAWQIVCLDEKEFDTLEQTSSSFWASFKAFFIVAPIYMYSNVVSNSLSPGTQAPPSLFAVFSLLALLWVLWPWLMVAISHMLGCQKNYVRYIIAYNWTSVFIVSALIPVLLLHKVGILGAGVAGIMSLVVVIWSLFMRWFVARHGLAIDGFMAFALVAGDLILSIAGSYLI